MKYTWLEEYCLSKKGAIKEYKAEWDAIRYLIGNKMFAMHCGDKEKKEIITLKNEPQFGQILRTQHEHIIPGYYMNKDHWSSIYLDGDVPDNVLQQMIDQSYELVLGAMSKKAQKEILEG